VTGDLMTGVSAPVEMRDVAPWVERLARVGYGAKALLYITIGILAAGAAFGWGGRATDTEGALRLVYRMTFGRVMLVVAAAGLLGYALWRVVEALMDPDGRGNGPKGIALRIGFAVRGLFHGALGIGAFRLAYGDRTDSPDRTRDWTAFLLDMPAGELLVWLAGGSVIGYGLYQLYRSFKAKLGRQLDLSSLSGQTHVWIVGVSRFGIAARGIVFCLIGFFLARAASQHDAGQAGGIQQSLATLARVGRWPFAAVALGLMAYGAYELLNARYRRIRMT